MELRGDVDVTVCVPTIPPRVELLRRALRSVKAQEAHPVCVHVETAETGEGAWTVRNRTLEDVTTEWIAFLDDDDEFMPHHLRFLIDAAERDGHDVVWGWFRVAGGGDPFPKHRGRQYDPERPHVVPITYLARSELLLGGVAELGGFQPDKGKTMGNWMLQDQPLLSWMAHRGSLRAYDETTWIWHHHTGNTSGMPARWST